MHIILPPVDLNILVEEEEDPAEHDPEDIVEKITHFSAIFSPVLILRQPSRRSLDARLAFLVKFTLYQPARASRMVRTLARGNFVPGPRDMEPKLNCTLSLSLSSLDHNQTLIIK